MSLKYEPIHLIISVFVIMLGLFLIAYSVEEAYQVETTTGWMPVDSNGDGQADYYYPIYGTETKYRTLFPFRGLGIFVTIVGVIVLVIGKIMFRMSFRKYADLS